MNWLLLINNLSSGVLVIACWWLAHQNARSRPPGRWIAGGYALLGFSALLTAIVRNLGVPSDWLTVLSKIILAGTLILVILRRARRGLI